MEIECRIENWKEHFQEYKQRRCKYYIGIVVPLFDLIKSKSCPHFCVYKENGKKRTRRLCVIESNWGQNQIRKKETKPEKFLAFPTGQRIVSIVIICKYIINHNGNRITYSTCPQSCTWIGPTAVFHFRLNTATKQNNKFSHVSSSSRSSCAKLSAPPLCLLLLDGQLHPGAKHGQGKVRVQPQSSLYIHIDLYTTAGHTNMENEIFAWLTLLLGRYTTTTESIWNNIIIIYSI